MDNWIESKGTETNIVLSSRIRLARNLMNFSFPEKLPDEKGKAVIKQVEEAFHVSSPLKNEFKSIYLWEQDENINKSYVEKHFISPKLLQNSRKAAFLLNKEETVSIMLNEEDHIRLQVISAGFNLEEIYAYADKLDNLLEENLDYAYDEELGYLTACPTNIGTGMRASVMVHLPALSINNEMNGVFNAVTKVGMTIRGLYGEGSRAEGDLFQISNQITLGLSEEDIINNLKAVVNQIINQESWSREQILKAYKYELEDKIFRSLGILKTAVLLDSKECLNLLSNVRMGVEMGIIKDVDKRVLNSLLIDTQPASLQQIFNSNLSEKMRDFNRAKLVRDKLGNTNIN